jgi:hypothetical protein
LSKKKITRTRREKELLKKIRGQRGRRGVEGLSKKIRMIPHWLFLVSKGG